METYITLLRGINVGGNNSIKMAELKTCFERMGFTDVQTYIQSGNVVFKASDQDVDILTNTIENALTKEFKLNLRVVTITKKHLAEVVSQAPHGFGTEPDLYRYDVIFLKRPFTAHDAIKDISLKEGVDTVDEGNWVLYFSRLIEKATQSKLSRIITMPIYKNMTIRNWNTTTKLRALTEK